MSQQGLRQASLRAISGATSGDYNSNLIQAARACTGLTHALTANEAEIALLKALTFTNNVSGLVALRGRYAAMYGFRRYDDVNRFPFAFDFTQGGSAFPLSTTRAHTGFTYAYAETSAGVWVPFAANAPRITDKGLLVEEARTNKSTNYNAATNGSLTNLTKSGDAAATLTEVDDTAALQAAGFSTLISQGVMNGKVFKLDNSGGVASAFVSVAGNAGNTNTHAVSAYVRGGTGTIGVQTGTSSSFTASATYQRRTHTGAGVSAFGSFLRADAGQTIYFIMNVFEEGAFVTSPIIISGASSTRAADVISLTGAAATAALNAKSAFAQTNAVATSVNSSRIFEIAGTQSAFFNTSSSIRITPNSGTNYSTATFGAGTVSSRAKIALGFDNSGTSAVANAGSKATDATSWGTPSGTVYLANRFAGDRALNGYMERIAFSNTKGAFDAMTA